MPQEPRTERMEQTGEGRHPSANRKEPTLPPEALSSPQSRSHQQSRTAHPDQGNINLMSLKKRQESIKGKQCLREQPAPTVSAIYQEG